MFDELYDRNVRLVAWTDGEHVFDHSLNWVAFVHHGEAFSAVTLQWLGPVVGLTHQDRHGRAVLWNPRDPVTNSRVVTAPGPVIRPARPPQPLPPTGRPQPHPPRPPLGGWSDLDFHAWLAQTSRAADTA